mmetsp:Transcript_9143/g.13022  ORF Transcript_9143/g.13022 Transcript_9143/m.13022 type:complete len:86 (-) Transcript_9143:174-431(-)
MPVISRSVTAFSKTAANEVRSLVAAASAAAPLVPLAVADDMLNGIIYDRLTYETTVLACTQSDRYSLFKSKPNKSDAFESCRQWN